MGWAAFPYYSFCGGQYVTICLGNISRRLLETVYFFLILDLLRTPGDAYRQETLVLLAFSWSGGPGDGNAQFMIRWLVCAFEAVSCSAIFDVILMLGTIFFVREFLVVRALGWIFKLGWIWVDRKTNIFGLGAWFSRSVILRFWGLETTKAIVNIEDD